jgi:hypothetical protein
MGRTAEFEKAELCTTRRERVMSVVGRPQTQRVCARHVVAVVEEDMKHLTALQLLVGMTAVALLASCQSRQVRTYQGVEVSLESITRTKEFKAPPSERFIAPPGKYLAVFALRASRDPKLPAGMNFRVIDAGGQTYEETFQQAFHFEDGHVEIKALFKIPDSAVLKSLEMGSVSFDLSRVPTKQDSQ